MREGWKYKKLSDCCEVLNGFAFKSDKYVEAGTRVIRITNVQKGYIVDDDPKYYPDDEMSHLGQYCLYENDLLMSLTGNVGRVGLLQKEMLPAALNQRVACLRIKGRDISLRYLFHCLNSVVFEQKAIYSATGIAQKNMSTEWLKKYEIPVPSISEQERVVAELDCLSGVIENQKQQLKELDNLAQAIFYDMFGDPIANEKGWEVKKVNELCSIFGRIGFRGYTTKDLVNNPEDGAITLSPSNIVNGHLDYTKCTYISWYKYEESPEIKIFNEDILLVKTGSSYGKCALVRNLPHKATINPQFVVLKDFKANNRYLTSCLQSTPVKSELDRFTIGAAIPTFSQKNLGNMQLANPPITLQQEFASKIEAIEKQKELIKQSLSETETLFNSRMDYYFN